MRKMKLVFLFIFCFTLPVFAQESDAVQTANMANLANISATGYNSEQYLDSGLVAYWSFGDSTATDNSGNGHNGTVYGATPVSGIYKQAFNFDGQNDFIQVPNSSSLNPASITLTAWYKPTSFSGNGYIIYKEGFLGAMYVAQHQYYLKVYGNQPNPSQGSAFGFGIAASQMDRETKTQNNFWVPGHWYCIVGTYDGQTLKLYVNGHLQSSYYTNNGAINNCGRPLRLGKGMNSPSDTVYASGIIDEVRIYNRALSQDEVGKLYVTSGLVAYWSFDDSTATDNSGNGHNGALHGTTPVPGVSGLGTALSFDGIDDYVEVPDSSDLNPANAITLTAWYKPVSGVGGAGADPIIGKAYTSHSSPYYQYQLEVNRTAGARAFIFEVAAGGNRIQAVTPTYFYSPGSWYFIVGTYDGNSATLYINDSLINSVPASGTVSDYGKPIRFARYGNPPFENYYLPGTIDEARIYNRALTRTEISYLYNFGTIPRHPDLLVDSLTIPPDGWTGQAMDVKWTVGNHGDSTAFGPWTENVYLSTDSLIGGDNLVSTFTYAETLGVGESYTHIHPVPIPEDAPGRYWVVVKTDATNNVGEYDKKNNNTQISNTPVMAHQSPYPDLRVTSVEGPSSALSGDKIDVSWSVKNSGTGATDAPIWYDNLYLSQDTILSTGDLLLGQFQNFSYLQPGQSYQQTKEITLPWGIFTDNYHFIVFTDSKSNVNEHTAELNNKGFSALTTHIAFVPAPAPEVSIINVVAPSTGVQVSPPVQVSWRFTNIGNLSTTTGLFKLHLCMSQNLSSSIASFGPFGTSGLPFIIGDTLSGSASISIPWYASGPYYIGIVTFGWSQNTVPDTAWAAININQRQPSDLEVTTVSRAVDTLQAGSRITIGWTVRNNGPGPTLPTSWNDAIWLSTTPTLDTTHASLIGIFPHSQYLQPDTSYTQTHEMMIPQTDSGTYYVFACADYGDTVEEGAYENNNCNHTVSPIQVLFRPPDLQVFNIGPTSTAWSGQSVWAKWTVKNAGVGTTPNIPWIDKIYLSEDSSLQVGIDSLVGNKIHSQPLGVNSSYSDSVKVTFANGISGTRYLFTVTDTNDTIYESNEGNNIRLQSFYVTLTPPPDLRVSQLFSPDSAFSGQTITIQWTAVNLGFGGTRIGSWKDKVYLSANNDTSNVSQDTVLYTSVHSDTLGIGKSYSQSCDITIPSGKIGQFYLKVFTDAGDSVYEYDKENNNIKVHSIVLSSPGLADLPDLIVTNFHAPAQITAGDTFTVSWTIKNLGEHSTSMSASNWSDAIYISTDTSLDVSSDILVSQLNHLQNLKPDNSYTVTKNFVCTDGVSGQRYLFLLTDFTNKVAEASDSNNSAFKPADFNLIPPDLYVTSIIAPDSATCGQPIDISWTVVNQGIGPTKVSSWYDGVYLSKDQILDPTDYNLGSWKHQGILKVDSTYGASLGAAIPPGLAGPYYIMVKTDKNNNVYEHNNENNNYRRTQDAIQIILPPPVNLTVTNINIPDSCFPGEPVTISWTVTNTDSSDVTGKWTDAVYISADTVWDYYNDLVIGEDTLTGTLKAGKSYTKTVALDIGKFFPGNLEANLPGVVPGSYHVFVRTDIYNNINETNEYDNQSFSGDSLIVDVRNLAVGVPDSSTITTNQRKYYKINPGAGYDLKLSLDIAPSGSPEVEFFVRHNEVPNRIHYDYHFDQTLSSHQVIKIPNTQTGPYYILVSGIHTQSPSSPYTLLGTRMAFSIESISPLAIGDSGQVTLKLYGARFEQGATVALVGPDTCVATNVTIEDRTFAKARFDLNMAEHGLYDVVLVNPGSDSAISQQGVTIEAVRWGDIEVNTYGNHEVRPGTELTMFSQVINHNNIDIPFLSILLGSAENGIGIKLETSWQRSFPSTEDDTLFPGSVSTGGAVWSSLILRDLVPFDTTECYLKLKSASRGATPFTFHVQSERRIDKFVSEYIRAAEGLRQGILDNDSIRLSDEVKAVIGDSSLWSDAMLKTAVNMGLLDSIATYLLPGNVSALVMNAAEQKPASVCPGALDWADCLKMEIEVATAPFIELPLALELAHGVSASMSIVECATTFGEYMSPECFWEEHCPPGEQLVHVIVDIPEYGAAVDHGYGCMPKVVARDPNEKVGPTGSSGNNLIPVTNVLPYTIYFENTPDATAPAVTVTITDQLDTNLDWRTFRLGEFAFGDKLIEVPPFRSQWQAGVNLSNLVLNIDAGINAYTGEVHWTFKTIDPKTGLPVVDPNLGFLPPNDSTGRGQGHVSYTIKAKQDLPDGTEIKNKATIVFDTNDPIETNEVLNVTYTPYPDLVVISTSVESDWSILPIGQRTLLKATVQNQGLGDCGNFYVKLFLGCPDSGGVLIASPLVNTLTSGQSKDVYFSWTPTQANDNAVLYFYVDYGDSVHEMNEENNLRTMTVRVQRYYLCGDPQRDGKTSLSDIVYLVNYLFKGGPPPLCSPYTACGDAQGDGKVTVSDVVYTINYLFKYGPPPKC